LYLAIDRKGAGGAAAKLGRESEGAFGPPCELFEGEICVIELCNYFFLFKEPVVEGYHSALYSEMLDFERFRLLAPLLQQITDIESAVNVPDYAYLRLFSQKGADYNLPS